jgi:hypothetical protein
MSFALRKKKYLCAHPSHKLSDWSQVLKKVSGLPLVKNGPEQSLTAGYENNGEHHRLTAKASILKLGLKGGPILIFLPWFGGKSINLKHFLSLKNHPSWTFVGIDPFYDPKGLDQILYMAEGSRHAYALVTSMLTRLIKSARAEGRKVGVVGLSYGANIINAYLSLGLEAPDAIVAIEGGNIVQTTLHGKWKGDEYDPKILEALVKNPAIIPVQKPTDGIAAKRSLAVINQSDKVVLDQEETWQNAKTKLQINGAHFVAPILSRHKIRVLANQHLQNLL